jgi:hypothetical protein
MRQSNHRANAGQEAGNHVISIRQQGAQDAPPNAGSRHLNQSRLNAAALGGIATDERSSHSSLGRTAES